MDYYSVYVYYNVILIFIIGIDFITKTLFSFQKSEHGITNTNIFLNV